MPNIRLQSLDGEVFEVDVEIAKQSVTIKTMLEDLGVDDDEEEAIPLPNVNAAILKKVIQWCTYHKVGMLFSYYISNIGLLLFTAYICNLYYIVPLVGTNHM